MISEVTLVTGASHGLGRAIVEWLAAAGTTVINVDTRDPEPGAPGIHHRVDFADEAHARAALRELCGRYEVSRLVNYPVAGEVHALERTTVEELDGAIQAELGAALLCVNAALPGMRERGFGRIVNVVGTAVTGREGYTMDGITHGALVAMTRTWALEFARFGITVNAIAPGRIETVSHDDAKLLAPTVGSIPAGRAGRGSEVAQAAAFFLDPHTTFVTGQLLFVCGGQSLGVQPA